MRLELDMSKRKSRIGKPIQKKLPVESPDKIPEGQATLEDYEKMTNIIDIKDIDCENEKISDACSLDKSQCVEKEEIVQETIIQKEPEFDYPIDEGEKYKLEEDESCPTDNILCKDIVPEECTYTQFEEMKKLFYIEENNKLLGRVKKLESDKRELENEISRLNMVSASLKLQLDKLINDKRLPPHTYSPNTYVNCEVINPKTGQRVVKPQTSPYMNGYESWC